MRNPDITWPVTLLEARNIQKRDRCFVTTSGFDGNPELIAGVDAAFSEEDVYAAACLYRYHDMTLIEQTARSEKRLFPYVPGYLFFLEGRAVITVLNTLKKKPDLVVVDGHGIAHPLGIGSASHLGVLLGVPTIGCAKTRLVGEFSEPGNRKGSWSRLSVQKKTVGAVVRTRDDVRPVFVSPGHGIDLDAAIRIVLGCTGRYRFPEPLRCADMLSRRRRDEKSLSFRRAGQ